MAFVVIMQWPEVTKERYEAVRADLDWVNNQPEGAYLHIAGWDDKGFRVIDVWETPEQYQAFVESRLQPAVARIGMTTQPEVTVYPASYVDQFKDLPA